MSQSQISVQKSWVLTLLDFLVLNDTWFLSIVFSLYAHYIKVNCIMLEMKFT